MNTHQYDEAVYRVAADTLESLALMFLLPEDEAPQPCPLCNKRVAVSFTGPFDGMLILAVSEGVLSELAANMLGLENGYSPTLEQQEDALKELVNVICGNLLPAIAGKEPVFHIGAPEALTAESSPQAVGPLLPAGEARLLADAGVLELSLLVGRPSPVSA
jgi:CheY-specific phosphatase CheX